MTNTDLQARYTSATVVSHYTAADQSDSKTCDCCGQGIIHINGVRLADGELVHLGNDCVERVGLSNAELKAWWAQKFAENRRLAQEARWAAQDAEERAKANGLPQADALIAYYQAAQAEHERRGGVGSVVRNGTWDSIYADYDNTAVEVGYDLATGGRVRAIRVEGAAELIASFVRSPFRGVTDVQTDTVYSRALFDLDGNVLDARLVDGNYGPVWRVSLPGGGVDWFNASKTRNEDTARRNNAKKGYYVGACRYEKAGNNARWWADTNRPPVVILDNGLLPYDGRR